VGVFVRRCLSPAHARPVIGGRLWGDGYGSQPGPVDSDGDGFSNDDEVNSTPGTDPNDPTDNPNNVRDTDGDGCSDYDEINFPNFCDSDPYTPLTACNTAFYNADFAFGFDLSTNALLTNTMPNEGGIIFGATWMFLFDGGIVGQVSPLSVNAFVAEEQPQSLADWVTETNQTAESLGLAIVESSPITLADGTAAYFTSLIIPTDVQIDALAYRVDTFANGYVYVLSTGFPDNVPTEAEDAYLLSILDSLCID
jgi:hypothetical protein